MKAAGTSKNQLVAHSERDAERRITRLTDVAHLAILRTLLESDASLSQAVAFFLQIVDADGDVAETTSGLLVSIGVLEVCLRLGSFVPAQLEYTSAC